MVGPPGTGKTLLAKAIAGEAKVPFFTLSGSDFVEMFVGVGASRVRDVFEQAKKAAPCVVFIDEIDAVGRQRGAGLGGGHDEREQTRTRCWLRWMASKVTKVSSLSPRLTVRTFSTRPCCVLAVSTVRLWSACQMFAVVEQILKVRSVAYHSHPISTRRSFRGTPGFSGADLANLVNEAALFAARGNKRVVSMVAGRESERQNHDGCGTSLHGDDGSAEKIDGLPRSGSCDYRSPGAGTRSGAQSDDYPRGRALGVTFFLPEGDAISASRQKLESQISTLYGGRLAEEIIYGPEHVSTGASNDIKVATNLARNMVTQWGFSEKLGPLLYAEEEGEVFLGRSVRKTKRMSVNCTHHRPGSESTH